MSPRARSLVACTALALCTSPRLARAFSDVEAFDRPALEGGGAGRYFTGSPRDPHSCSVCHAGGRAPEVSVEGLPDALVPGSHHEVRIRWQGPKTSHALHLELSTRDGRPADIELAAEAELPRQERCEQREDGEPAVFSRELGERRVLGVQDCGASELRFAFTVADESELFFSLGVVRSDGSGTPEGDGAYEQRTRLSRMDEPRVSDGCSIALERQTGGSGAAAPLLLLLGACVWRALRRARRAVRPSLRGLTCAAAAVLAAGCLHPDYEDGERDREDAGSPLVDEFARLLRESSEGAGDAATAECAREPEPGGAMQFSVRTVSGSGRYRPRNVGAIWIADAEGNWIKTLERWGTRRAKWLTEFNAASGGDVVDAVTGPTLSSHRVHEVRWDLTDRSGCEVDDGSYQVRIELTDWSGTGPTTSVAFDKGAEPLELTPADEPPFLEMQLRVE